MEAKTGAKAKGGKNPEPKDKQFFVVPVVNCAVVEAPDEKSAVRAIAAEDNFAGKLLVLECDYGEIHAVTHRIEVKGVNVADYLKGLSQNSSDAADEKESDGGS